MPFALGMPALIEMPGLPGLVDLCQELELSFIELNMNMPENCPESLDPMEVRDVTRSTGIEFTLHSPDELDLGSLHPTVREGHLGRMREALGWCAQAGVKVLNMHVSPGIYFTLPDRKVWIYERYVDQFTSNLWTAYKEMLPLARASGVDICTENVNNFDLPFVAQAIDELCCMDSFFLTWDVGHDARSGFREQEVLLRHEDRVRHMHLHDYNGKSDHQVPGTGMIDIPGMIAFARRRDFRVLVEVKNVAALRESARAVKGLL
ncbi:MAG: sugar phosphate isomerase/epimerase [Methanomassiliicoccus sp.]|nr:sugar phosphate isomerase/epimerase [Methanomassiliicoccus sp.]